MADGILTQHLVIDLKTGFSYGVQLDSAGHCTAVQAMNTVIQRLNNTTAMVLSPLTRRLDPLAPLGPNEGLPFGQTIHAAEWAQDGRKSEIFTLVWPTEKEFEKGARPLVSRKDMPGDMVKAGFAPIPQPLKGQKGSGVDDEESLKEALKSINDMIGLDKAKYEIEQNIAIAQFNRMKVEMGLVSKPISRHMVFTGNPGTGKTTFAREVVKVYHALGFIDNPVIHEVHGKDLIGSAVGETVKKTAAAIEKAKGGILFIDEAYALSQYEAGGSNGQGTDFGAQAITELVAAMENMRDELIVIVAGYKAPMEKFINANEGLKSRFMTYINFEDYSGMQLGQILDFMTTERGCVMEPDARAHAMHLLESEKTRAKQRFGNGRDVRNLVEKTEKALAMRLKGENKLGRKHGLSDEALKTALTHITLQDVKTVALDGLAAKQGNTAGSIGFEARPLTFPASPPANDPTQPAARKISAKAHFGL